MGKNGNCDLPFLHSENEILSNGLDTKVVLSKARSTAEGAMMGTQFVKKYSLLITVKFPTI